MKFTLCSKEPLKHILAAGQTAPRPLQLLLTPLHPAQVLPLLLYYSLLSDTKVYALSDTKVYEP